MWEILIGLTNRNYPLKCRECHCFAKIEDKMTTEIITGLPIPHAQRRGAEPKYPWLQMKPGQAFKFTSNVTLNGARSMASQQAGSLAVKFAVRQCADGIYCWRVDGLPDEPPNGNYRQEISVVENYEPQPASETAVVGYEGKTRPLHRVFTQANKEPDIASNEAALARLGNVNDDEPI